MPRVRTAAGWLSSQGMVRARTAYIRAGGGDRQLQSILGHQRIETTMIYVHLADQDVESDHALHSPARVMGLLVNCHGSGNDCS